ncbi:MAG: heavy-metal-associated domain-containing protein [Epsilonproteobacteria bacterium]|nr:heavy-metal-associated domain-containing protein [Campylobacterota bacterium]
MKKAFEVLNIKCSGCANTVQKSLKPEYGEVEVNLEVMPRVVTLEVSEDFDEDTFRQKMKSLGYPLADETLGAFEEVGTKAKSFVSCAIGKMDQKK